MLLEFCLFLWDHGELEPEPRCFTNIGVKSLRQEFTLNFCGQEFIFSMVVNLVHESMFSNLLVMMLEEKDLSQSLWLVGESSKLFWKGNGV